MYATSYFAGCDAAKAGAPRSPIHIADPDKRISWLNGYDSTVAIMRIGQKRRAA